MQLARWIILFVLSAPSFCWAYDKDRVKENLKDDYGVCAEYYQYVLKFVKTSYSLSAERLKPFEDNVDVSLRAYMLLVGGETTEQIEAHIDFYNLELRKMYNSGGIDKLFVTYSDLCKSLLENPKQRIQYWENK